MIGKILAPILILILFSSHVGSPGVIFEGLLGPYRVLANINPPDVVPGTAVVTVIIPETPEGISLEARPVYWSAGLKGTPKADPLYPVKGEIGKYEGELWFMEPGTSSVQLMMTVGGETFEAIIPVMAVPTAQKEMPVELGIILVLLGVLLVVLMVTIVASAMSDSIREPGMERTVKSQKRKQIGIVVGTLVMLLILWGGKSWWDAESNQYRNYMFEPLNGTATFESSPEGNFLHLEVDPLKSTQGRVTRRISFIVPDHGKLMHLFLIRKGDLDVFAHLHPERLDTLNFKVKLPPLPSGDYHVFADITRYTGFAETIVADLTIPETNNFKLASNDPVILGRDDTYTFSNPVSNKLITLDGDIMICGKPGIKTDLPGGYSAVWETETGKFEAGKLYSLDFALFDPEGEPASLEPYLGMMGHAVVLKHDGTVYIHLHPTGNYSMGSQQMLVDRFKSGKIGFSDIPQSLSFQDSIDRVVAFLDALPDAERDSLLMGNMVHYNKTDPGHEEHSMVSFPYAFPDKGNYRIWIQVKIDGKIVNGAFDVEVE
ncbi:hypothetical protein [Cecembia calidifontis]|jgi:hypothetical protein|uniref:Uncharacterized protein n=1 Tax=Cecembia calidifontis TaxID=1187080 RepID=A0A4Q7PFA2_9BACT|nr:hypothetical protein [Cecembia calidifontis]RZS98350.1 hypothetical protein BC751_3997 [Cecembia calidifontis]